MNTPSDHPSGLASGTPPATAANRCHVAVEVWPAGVDAQPRHRVEMLLLKLFVPLMRWLGPRRGTAAMGAVAAFLGPFLPPSRRIRKNLDHAMPDATMAQRKAIEAGTWRSLAMQGMEYFYTPAIVADPDAITVEGASVLAGLGDGPVIFFSAHIGNWELARIAAGRLGWPAAMLYRRFNNPLFDHMVVRVLATAGAPVIHKGKNGAIQLARCLKSGQAVMLLMDQRLSNGMEVPFFGRPAMTADTPLRLAARLGARLVPVRAIRTGPCRATVRFETPIDPPTGNDDVQRVLGLVNDRIEAWVRETPEQWFWLHRRWRV